MSYGISNAEFESASLGLEAGYAAATVTKETPVTNANGTGVYFTFTFTDGPNKGRNINSSRYYWKHSNAQTAELAKEQIARVSKACGAASALGQGEHVGKHLIIGIREGDNGYMEVYGFKRAKGVAAVAGAPVDTSLAPF